MKKTLISIMILCLSIAGNSMAARSDHQSSRSTGHHSVRHIERATPQFQKKMPLEQRANRPRKHSEFKNFHKKPHRFKEKNAHSKIHHRKPHRHFEHRRSWGNSVFYPFYPLYPNYNTSMIFFICYNEEEDQYGNTEISCHYPITSFSTQPIYNTLDYQRAYRPEYICPRRGKTQFITFLTRYEANAWWDRYCN